MRALSFLVRYASLALLFGLCLEVMARIDDWVTYRAPFWGRYDESVLRELDADGIPRNVPGARFEKWNVNSLGFRGPEAPREKPPGIQRVVCLGQSESFGLYEGEGDEWPAALGRMLRRRHPDVEVLNASVVGTGRRTRKAYLDKYVLPLDPDVVVLYFNVLNEAAAALDDPGPDRDPQAAPARRVRSAADALPQLRVLKKMKVALQGALPASFNSRVQAWLWGRKLRALEEELPRPPVDAIPDEDVAGFEGHVRDVVALLRSRGIRPVLATYPTLVAPENASRYWSYLSAQRLFMVQLSERGLMDAARRLNEVTRRVSRDLDVPLVDVDAIVPKDADHFADLVHYTSRGAELVAASTSHVLETSHVLR